MADDLNDVPETGGPGRAAAPAATAASSTPSGGKRDPNKIVRGPFKRTKYISADWGKLADSPGAGLQEVAVEIETTADGRDLTWVLDGSGDRYPDPASTSPNPAQREIWENQQKDDAAANKDKEKPAGEAKPTNVYVGRNPKSGKPTEVSEWPDGHVTYDDTNVPTATASGGAPGGKAYVDDGPEVGKNGRRWGWNPETKLYDRDLGPSPAAQKGPVSAKDEVKGHPGVFLVKSKDADGNEETHYEDKDGNTVPQPVDEASDREEVTGHPGVFLVITKKGTNTEKHYENAAGETVPAPTEDPKPIEGPDGSYGYWDNTKKPPVWVPIQGGPGAKKDVTQINGQYGYWDQSSTPPKWVQVEGPPQHEAIPMDELPDPEKITAWLWSEQKKLDQAVTDKKITPEEAIAEMKKRRDFATSVAAEHTAAQSRTDRTQDREAENSRAGLRSGTDIYTSTAPTMLKAGMTLQPGNGQTAAEGFMAALELGRMFAEKMAGGPMKTGPRTSVAPDGTVTVDHGGVPQPFRNDAGQMESPAGGVYTPGPYTSPGLSFGMTPGAPAPNEEAAAAIEAGRRADAMANPVFRPSPPEPGSETPVPDDPAAMAAMIQQGGAVPGWMQQQGNPDAQPQADSSYLYDVGQDDPSWQEAVQEAERRRRQSVSVAA